MTDFQQGDRVAHEQRRRLMHTGAPPINELPVTLPWTALLGRADDIAVALPTARICSTGIELDIAVRARGTASTGLSSFMGGHHAGSELLLLGVELADGRTAQTSTAQRTGHRRPTISR